MPILMFLLGEISMRVCEHACFVNQPCIPLSFKIEMYGPLMVVSGVIILGNN